MSRIESPDPRERHFGTDALTSDLNRRTVHSGAAMLIAQVVSAAVALAATVLLARILRPGDFGVVAMALPIAVVGTVLRNFGLDIAIIQRGELDQRRVSALFWLSLKLNLALATLLALLAPALVWLYDEPDVLAPALVFAGGVLALGLGGVHEALLKRQMRFRALSILTLVAAVAGAGSAVALAFAGAAYWSLVAQLVVSNLVQAVGAWLCCDWRPLAPRACAAVGDTVSQAMVAYGRNLTATRLLTVGANYADRVVVGWMAGPVVLGLYENGRRLPFFILDKLYDACFSVAVAGFSRAGDDPARYRTFGATAIQLVLGLLLPCLAFLLVEAERVTLLLLGPQWLPAVPYARLLALAAFAQGITRTLQWFYLSRDDTVRQFRWNAWQTIVILGAVGCGGWLGGTVGVAIGFTAAACLLPVPAVVYGLRNSPFSPAHFARAAARPIALSLGAAAVLAFAANPAGETSPLVAQCAVAALVYGAVYITGWLVHPAGRTTLADFLRLLRSTRAAPDITTRPPPPGPSA